MERYSVEYTFENMDDESEYFMINSRHISRMIEDNSRIDWMVRSNSNRMIATLYLLQDNYTKEIV